MVRVCFVCLGNICRSPTAAGVMQRLVSDAGLADRIEIESAGTAGYHVGEPADARSRAAARARGVELEGRAQQFLAEDFDRFDYVLAADRGNLRDLERLAGTEHRGKLSLLRSFDPEAAALAEVPDPYYGGPRGFEEVLDVCERACAGLLSSIRARHLDGR